MLNKSLVVATVWLTGMELNANALDHGHEDKGTESPHKLRRAKRFDILVTLFYHQP